MPPKKIIKSSKKINDSESDLDSGSDSDLDSESDIDEAEIDENQIDQTDDENDDTLSELDNGTTDDTDDKDEDNADDESDNDNSDKELSESDDDDNYDECMYKHAKTKIESEKDVGDGLIDLKFDDDNVAYDDIVPNNERITKPILTLYERVRLLGDRAKQLSLGAKPMIKGLDSMNPKLVAKMELEYGLMPLIVERVLPDGRRERWKVNELKFIN